MRSTRATNTVELIAWAQDYERGDLYPHKDPQRRFGIGLYQIFQAMDWEDKATWVGYEGWASCAMHMFLCAGLLKLDIERVLKYDLQDIPFDPDINYEQL